MFWTWTIHCSVHPAPVNFFGNRTSGIFWLYIGELLPLVFPLNLISGISPFSPNPDPESDPGHQGGPLKPK